MNDYTQIVEHVICPKCGKRGAATWTLSRRKRTVNDLLSLSDGLACVDTSRHGPYIECASCRIPAVEVGSAPQETPAVKKLDGETTICLGRARYARLQAQKAKTAEDRARWEEIAREWDMAAEVAAGKITITDEQGTEDET
jgi:hypothetical protein